MDREINWRIAEWTTFFPSPTDPFYPRQSWNLAGELVGGFSATFTSQTFILAAIENCAPPPRTRDKGKSYYKKNPIILILCVCIKKIARIRGASVGMKLCMFDMSFAVPGFSLLAAVQSGGRYISSMTSSTEYTECQASCSSSELGPPPPHPQVNVAPPLGPNGGGGGGRGGPNSDEGTDPLMLYVYYNPYTTSRFGLAATVHCYRQSLYIGCRIPIRHFFSQSRRLLTKIF